MYELPPLPAFEATTEKKAFGLLWLWKVTRNGQLILKGLSFSEVTAQSRAAEAVFQCRKELWDQQYE